MKGLLAGCVAVLGLAVLGAVVMDESDDPPSPSTATTGTDRTPSSSPTSPQTSATSSATSSALSSPESTPSTSLEPDAGGTEPAIVTSESFYYGAPHETIHIPGTYQGVDGATRLRLQLRRSGGWTWFPLPVVTRESGEFRAYVELGPGEYRLRLVDPESGIASPVVTLLVV